MQMINAWLADLSRAVRGGDRNAPSANVIDVADVESATGREFDNFTRSLGSQTSRREVVKV